jgi:hypothetical protein
MNFKLHINHNLQYLSLHPYKSKYRKLWLTWNLEVINIYLLCCNWTYLHVSRQSAVGTVNGLRAWWTRKQDSIPVTACPLFPDRLWNRYEYIFDGRSQWPRDLRLRSTTARLLRSWVRIPPRAWKFFCCVCCQVEVSAASRSLFQRSPTDCGASLCLIKKPRERGDHSPRLAAEPEKIINK